MFRNFIMTLMKRTRSKDVKNTISSALLDPGPDIVVCDEGHLMKNSKSHITKAVSQIRTMKRVVLTGTPLQNNLNECKFIYFVGVPFHSFSYQFICRNYLVQTNSGF